MHQHWRAGHRVQLLQATDMIDVRVCAHDQAHGERMARQHIRNAIDVVARIQHQGFACLRIAQESSSCIAASRRAALRESFASGIAATITSRRDDSVSVNGRIPSRGITPPRGRAARALFSACYCRRNSLIL